MPQPPLLCYRLDRESGAGEGAATFDVFAFARSKAGAAAKIAKEVWLREDIRETFDDILLIRTPELDHHQQINKRAFVFAGYPVECDNQSCYEAADLSGAFRGEFVYCSEDCADADDTEWVELNNKAFLRWPWAEVLARRRGHTPACRHKDTGKGPRSLVMVHDLLGRQTLYCQDCEILAGTDPEAWAQAKADWELRGRT